MPEVMVEARLAACEAGEDAEALARALAERFVEDTSRFRIYRDKEMAQKTVARLLPRELLKADPEGPWFTTRRPPGSETLEGPAGKTTYSLSMGLRAAYIPDVRRWSVRADDENPTWVDVVKLDGIESGGGKHLRFPWDLWDLVVRLMAWEPAGYTEATLHGPMWQTGSPKGTEGRGLTEGLAEQYMADLLDKMMAVRPILRPAYAFLGEQYPFKNSNVTFREERRIPRISWVNVFGPSYVAKYGREFLLGAPGYRVEELEDGSIYYQVTEQFFQGLEVAGTAGPVGGRVQAYFGASPLSRRTIYRPTYLHPVRHRGSTAKRPGRA